MLDSWLIMVVCSVVVLDNNSSKLNWSRVGGVFVLPIGRTVAELIATTGSAKNCALVIWINRSGL